MHLIFFLYSNNSERSCVSEDRRSKNCLLILRDNEKSIIDEDILLLKVIEMKKKYLTYLNNIVFGFEFEESKFEICSDSSLGPIYPHPTKVNLRYERSTRVKIPKPLAEQYLLMKQTKELKLSLFKVMLPQHRRL